MPYANKKDLPAPVQNSLPEHAQNIYRKAFNSAWEEYDTPDKRREVADREETAHRVAWAAVKKVYEKNEYQKWVRKSS